MQLKYAYAAMESIPIKHRLPNRFFGLRNFPYLTVGIRGFKITFEITGLSENLDRNDRIEGPIGDLSINDTLSS